MSDNDMNDWNTQIIAEFRENDGKVGGPFEGAPLVLVHHKGAKTGTERVTPLVSQPGDGGRLHIFASKAGAPDNPDWYHNLLAHPETRVELPGESGAVRVRVTELVGTERNEIWDAQKIAQPEFADYEKSTDRIIPVLAVDRV